ncbi:MAG: alpha/beta hydrolase fold domain-containing protein [Eubacteriales bacterium]|nr:alpha/beta hydrolase fold domain-containing protein [Eubacteriales bacterium]
MKKRFITLGSLMGLALSITVCGQSLVAAADKSSEGEEEVYNFDASDLTTTDALVTELTVKVDGQDMKVTRYEDLYLTNPTIDDQKVSVYVPEGATDESPIILSVNNSGWIANSYSARTKINEGDEFSSTADDDKIGALLSRNYVLVSYGCRSRKNEPVNGVYGGHSPATISDTKAVIRYLRANKDALTGNTDKIIITGTSGGGALSTVVAASGDSADYYPALFESGAAGITQTENGYESTISDAVFGVIAYCPITDLGNGDAAYEWTYQETREALSKENMEGVEYSTEKYTYAPEISQELASLYSEYVDGLGLKLDDGQDLTSENLKDAIKNLMEAEIAESIEEIGADQMLADIAEKENGAQDWLVINEDGTFTYDIDKHLNWVAANKELKTVNAFSNAGLEWGNTNEDSLFGTSEYEYSAFEKYSWDHDSVEGNGCGLDDTGLTWDEFIATEEGQALLQQIKLTNAVAYLNDTGENKGIKAPFWYVRYGMNDRDSSFALETILRYSISNNADIQDYSFEFAWLKPHAGDYDVQEAYAWLDGVLSEN